MPWQLNFRDIRKFIIWLDLKNQNWSKNEFHEISFMSYETFCVMDPRSFHLGSLHHWIILLHERSHQRFRASIH